MEISFNVTCLSRNSEGKSKVSITACGVEGGQVYDSMIMFSRYVDVPYAQDHASVEAYIVKVLFNVSLAIQEYGGNIGITPQGDLMLNAVEHK
jgi:hypothetical protein